MKKLFLLAWPIALAAVSCSNEEVVSVNNDANEIKFTTVAENGTRAQNLFCNLNKPTTFNVWAAVNNATYFENVTYVKEATSETYKAEGGKVHFWPTTGTMVDFYALSEETKVKNGENPAEYNPWTGGVVTWKADGATKITWQTRSDNATEQTDLLYAYTQKSRPTGTAGIVGINFRHALSQIVFHAKNTNPTIQVFIDKVDVVNIAKAGTFAMPYGVANVTDAPIENHKTEGPDKSGVGSWTVAADAEKTTYTTTEFDLVTVPYGNTGKNLTEEEMADAAHSNFGLSLLLIPQTTTAWVPATPTKKPTQSTGSYFVVYCKIQNVAASDGNAKPTDLYLWGDENNTAAVYIPFKADWKPGKKYIYTFTFGSQTTGGYDPEGDPVLIPISFNITVDDFVKVSDETVWMGPKES